MRLQRLTGLERDKIIQELKEIRIEIARLQGILDSEEKLLDLLVEESEAVMAEFGDERRTEIVAETKELTIEDLIVEEEAVVTVTHTGYIKRNALSLYRAQRRGGRGKTGMTTKEDDLVTDVFVASTHDQVLVFSDRGQCYSLKVYDIPQGGRATRGKAIVNILKMDKGEQVAELVPVKEFSEDKFVVFATRKGVVKKTSLAQFANARAKGIAAINLDDDDELIAVRPTGGSDEILLATKNGLSIRFPEKGVRPQGRATRGVKGISLREGDQVIGMEVLREGASILTVTENGYGKRTDLDEYRVQSRSGLGVITIKTSERNGKVVGIRQVTDEDELMLITSKGIIIRLKVREVRVIGRNTQGVRLLNLDKGNRLVAMAKLAENDEKDATEEADGEPGEIPEGNEEPEAPVEQ